MSPTLSLFRRAAAFVVSLSFVALAHAALPAGVTQGPSIEGFTEYKLANGLTVLLFPDASKPTTTVNVTYEVGSAYENYGETGMAHLLEHLVFKGTPARGNIMTELGKRGMTFNGSTGWERTNYFESFTAGNDNLDWALAMEADRMVNSYIRRSDLDSEMTVVRNEFESGENNPQNVLFEKMLAAAYEWHNYGHTPIGARSDIENVNIERLQAFYRMYYQPDNAVLIVAGKFDPEPTLQLIAKYFGPIPKPTRKLPPIYTAEPVQDGERTVTLRRVGNEQYLAMMFHTVRGAHPDYIATDALGELMTVAPAGRLYKSLVETKKAASVEVWQEAQKDPGSITFFAQIPEGEAIAPAREAMFATFENLKKEPITEAEVARVRAKAAKYFDNVISDPQKLGVAISEAVALGDWRLFFIQRDRYRNVTAADAQRVALDYLKRANVTVGEFIPDAKPDRAPVPAPVDLAAIVKDYKGDPAAVAGETFDASPANLEARTQRITLPERHEARAAAEEDARGGGPFLAHPALRRREIRVRQAGGRRPDRLDVAARNREAEPPGNRRHARPVARQGRGARQRHRRVGVGADLRQGAAGNAAPRGRGSAHAVVPGRGARQARARAAHRAGSLPHRPALDRVARGAAQRQSVSRGRPALRADARRGNRGAQSGDPGGGARRSTASSTA